MQEKSKLSTLMANRTILLLVIATVFKSKVVQCEPGKLIYFDPLVFKAEIEIKDSQTFSITNFEMHLKRASVAPQCWFVVGNEDMDYMFQYIPLRYTAALRNQDNVCAPINVSFSGEGKGAVYKKEFELRLPGDLTMSDITFLAIYAPKFFHNIGYYEVPPQTGPGKPVPEGEQIVPCYPREYSIW